MMNIAILKSEEEQVASYETMIKYLMPLLRVSQYNSAIDALEFVIQKYDGRFRKDGITPALSHQLFIMHQIYLLRDSIQDPENCIVLAALHDITEDGLATDKEIRERFGESMARSVWIMNKKNYFVASQCFAAMALDARASLVKAFDRIHNLLTMWFFSPDKRSEYRLETELIVKMVIAAQLNFPAQLKVYTIALVALQSAVTYSYDGCRIQEV